MPYHSKELAKRWKKMPLVEQMANIGSEVYRAMRWQGKNQQSFELAYTRALELFDLTIADSRWKKRLKELTRLREVFCDAILGGKEYNSSLADIERYFFYFAVASRLGK